MMTGVAVGKGVGKTTTEPSLPTTASGCGVDVGCGVGVGCGVAAGCGVDVGCGVTVGWGGGIGCDVAVGCDASAVATRASTVDSSPSTSPPGAHALTTRLSTPAAAVTTKCQTLFTMHGVPRYEWCRGSESN